VGTGDGVSVALTREEAGALVEIRDDRALTALMARARAVRREAFGATVTYSPKVFIPLTKLCRDVCHYCTFAQQPKDGTPAYLDLDEVLAIAERGREAGCTEALFTLGDKPEERYRRAREELAAHGCATTAEYLRAAAGRVLEQTGLLPHLNPGVLSAGELAALRPVSASMGLMLESSSTRLLERGMPHHGSADKVPAVRLAAMERAGRLRIPLTSGILIGIGETRAERLDALFALRDLSERHGHLQEVIVQNFRAKPDTLMAQAPEPPLEDLLWTIAAARLVLPGGVSVQAPPNLSDRRFGELLEAGINDWGGVSPVTADHVNPEAPWPDLELLETVTADHGLDLAPRLTVYPRYVRELEDWVDDAVRPAVRAAADARGYGRRWRWFAGDPTPPPAAFPGIAAARETSAPVLEAIGRATRGEQLDEDEVVTLLEARGADWSAVVRAADDLRREVRGDVVTYVVNRNINYTNVCYFRCGFCAFSKGKLAANLRGAPYLVPVEEVVRRSVEAWQRGATEVCLQGGIHPGFDGDFYADLVRAIKGQLPDLHVHAFSPLEIWQGAATLGTGVEPYVARLRDCGLGSLPGTAAEVLDDEVRRILCPDKISTEQWREVISTAHRVGLPTTATIMFGHVDGARNWARHLLTIRAIQAATGGITEFVPLPFVHMEAPIALRGGSRHGPTLEETVSMHAVARLALHPHVTSIQTSWTKLGERGAALALAAGANDLGGTLMNESISRAAGADHGQELPPARMDALIRSLGREARQRTTLYRDPDAAQVERSYAAAPLSDPWNPSAREHRLPRREVLHRPGLEALAGR
jgi:FO synthase